MNNKVLKKLLTVVLTGAFLLSQPGVVYAAADAQDDPFVVTEENAEPSADEGEISEPAGIPYDETAEGEEASVDSNDAEVSDGENTEYLQGNQNIYEGYDSSYVDAAAAQAAEVSGSGDLTDEEKALLGISDETALAAAEEQVEAQMVQAAETALTGFTVTDSAGNTVREYVKDGIHYIFATNCTDLSNMTVHAATVFTSVPEGFAISEDGTSMTGAFSPGEMITVGTEAGDVLLCVMQSTVPSLFISLNGTTLAEIQKDKDIKYKDNALTLTTVDGGVLSETGVEVKGRGNTSWANWPKKGYQIKLQKKKSVLGMTDSKTWLLIPASADASLMKNKVAEELSEAIGHTTTQNCEYSDVWFDGEYVGLYLVFEKVQFGKGRIEVSDDNAVLVERDNAYFRSEDYYFQDGVFGYHYTMKDTNNSDEADLTGFTAFESTINSTLSALNAGAGTLSYDELGAYIDVDSFAKLYLIQEFSANYEALSTGFFMYQDGPGDVIHAGPGWDFEGTMGTREYMNYSAWHLSLSDGFFEILMQNPDFLRRVKAIYEANIDAFSAAAPMTDTLYGEIADSAAMNFIRFDYLGKWDTVHDTQPDTYEEAVANLRSWLENRAALFDAHMAGLVDIAEDGHVYRIVSAANGDYHIGAAGNNAAAGATAVVTRDNTPASYYIAHVQEDGSVIFENYVTGRVLDIYMGTNEAGTAIWHYGMNATPAQCWNPVGHEIGRVFLQSALGRRVVDIYMGQIAEQQRIWLYDKNYSDAQLFVLQDVTDELPDDQSDPLEDGGIYEIHPVSAPYMSLDVEGGSVMNMANIRIYQDTNTDAQKFVFRQTEAGWVITCYRGGKAIDVSGGSSRAGTNIAQYRRNDTAAQLWNIQDNGDGSYTFVNNLGNVLDVAGGSMASGTNVWAYAANGSAAQKFCIERCEAAETLDGTYRIGTALDGSLYLNVSGNNVVVGKSRQDFTLVHGSSGYYTIYDDRTGKVLDIYGGSRASGTNVWEYQPNGSAAQRWTIVRDEEGRFTILSALGTSLDVTGGTARQGTNVWAYEPNGTRAQQWMLN
ncbi:MAG: RICIN domain-containing protein [Lachnospiraceae bacterium]|nr:RICIN domain-containing protein [Lachnospiraceae bacterium]